MKRKQAYRGILHPLVFKKRSLPITLLFLFLSLGSRAQDSTSSDNYIIRGHVLSAEDDSGLPGVSVQLKKTSIGVTTEDAGFFALKTDKTSITLTISLLGYKSMTLDLRLPLTETLVIRLEEDVTQLTEVVVSTGYETVPKERATGSFAHIDNELFNRGVGTDVISRLKGVAPSLFFDERLGEVPVLSIRGRSTIFADAAPLIVVDNFPYEGDIASLNPNDIRDVTILRDAAAASIWGIRAGNGVIVITTKKGRRNQPFRLSFNTNVRVGKKPDLFYEPLMTAASFIEVEQRLFAEGYYDNRLNDTRNYPALSPVVDILAREREGHLSPAEAEAMLNAIGKGDLCSDVEDHFYRPSIDQQYALNLQGGGERYDYYLSAGFDRNMYAKRGNDHNRINVSAHQRFTIIDGLEFSSGIMLTQRMSESDNSVDFLRNAFPYTRLADDQGNPLPVTRDFQAAFINQATDLGYLDWRYVPLEESGNTSDSYKLTGIRLSPGITFSPVAGLKLDLKYQYEKELGEQNRLQTEDAYYVRDLVNRFTVMTSRGPIYNIPRGAILTRSANERIANNGRAQVNYRHDWNAHELALLGGLEVREVRSVGNGNSYYGYDVNTALVKPVNLDTFYVQHPSGRRARIFSSDHITGTLDRFRSYFFNGSYTYRSRYTLSASARIDQTNLFGVKANQRTVPLWSTGFKWTLDREGFYQWEWLPRLELRATYGYNGNFDPRTTAYITASYRNSGLTGKREASLGSLPNPMLRGEKTGVFNMGVAFATRNNILSGQIEFYRKRGKDLIGVGPMDATTGRTTFRGNLANMKGHGWDVELNLKAVNRAVKWDMHLLFSYTIDEVTHYENRISSNAAYFNDASLTGTGINPIEGKPLFAVYSYRWAGLDPETGDPQGYLNGETSTNYTNIAGDTEFEELVYHGRALPPAYGAFRHTFSYKQLGLSVNIMGKLGYFFRRPSIDYSSLFASGIGHSDYAKRWQEPGDELTTQVPSWVYPVNSGRDSFYANSEALVERGDHIRLQDIRLSYRLDNTAHPRRPFREMTCYIYAADLGILWRANDQGIDPDYNVLRRSGQVVLPAPASLSVGVSVKF